MAGKIWKGACTLALALLVAATLAAPVSAATPSDAAAPAASGNKSVSEKILDILRARGTISESEYEALKSEAEAEREAVQEAAKKDDESFKVFWKDGLRMESPDKNFTIKIGGRLMVDAGASSADQEVSDALGENNIEGFGAEIRRARLYAEGDIYKYFIYKAQFDFANNQVSAKDLYLGVTDIPFVGTARVGNQKVPFSLEELTSSKYITFMERSLPNAMSVGRRIGLGLNNEFLDHRIGFGAGAYVDADGTESYNNFDDWIADLRIYGTPIYNAASKMLLHLGASYRHNFLGGQPGGQDYRIRSRPEDHLVTRTVDTGTFQANGADAFGGEAAFVWGPFSMQGEYIQTFVDGAGDYDSATFSFPGAYVYASYFLTGESRPYKEGAFGRVKPFENFNFEGGWGAWEIAARWSWIDLNDSDNNIEIAGGEENDITVGLNWYWNPNMRWMLNYVWANIQSRDNTDPDINDGSVNLVETRFQVDF